MSERFTAPPRQGGTLQSATRLYCAGFVRCLPLSLFGSVCLLLAGNQWSARTPEKSGALDSLDQLDSLDLNSIDINAISSLTDISQLFGNALSASALISHTVLAAVFVLFCGALCLQLHTLDDAVPISGSAALLRALMRAVPAMVSCSIWLIVSVGCLALMLIPHVSIALGLLLLLPSIYWSGRLQFWLPPLFLEHAGVRASLLESWRLTHHQWWRALSELSIALLVIGVLEWVLDGIVALSSGELDATRVVGWPAVFSRAGLSGALSTAVLLPMLPAALLVIYRDLQRRRTQAANRQLGSSSTD